MSLSTDPKVSVIIPFRLRDTGDMRRSANLEVVMAWWWAHGFIPQVVDDGLSGDEQFNRHRAYNRAVERFPETDVFVFSEADMLIHPKQVMLAARLAVHRPGLIVPFTQYRYLSDAITGLIRDRFHDLSRQALAAWWLLPVQHPASMFSHEAESTMDNGRSIGAVNVVSRETLEITGGFTEFTHGNWYDDRVIEEGFAFLTGRRTGHVPGPAVHLYHLPGHTGDHLTEEDKKATQHNKEALLAMREYIKHNDREAVKSMMEVRR